MTDSVDLIYAAIEKSEPYRVLRHWNRTKPNKNVLRAMRRAIFRIDGTLQVTTDALEAAFEDGLKTLLRKSNQ